MQAYCRNNHIELREHEPLHSHTTFKIGGPAALVIDAPEPAALRKDCFVQ